MVRFPGHIFACKSILYPDTRLPHQVQVALVVEHGSSGKGHFYPGEKLVLSVSDFSIAMVPLFGISLDSLDSLGASILIVRFLAVYL